MNQLRENPFLTGVILLTVIACGALGFLLSGAMATHQGSMDAYTQAVQKLQSLQNRVPFPDQANLKQAEALRDAYKEKLEGLKANFEALQVPLDPAVTPQQFQDTLRATVNAVASQAEAAKVQLPDGFFLGFDTYKDSLPTDKAAPFLARQLLIISTVVKDLIGPNPENPGIKSIDALVRTPLAEESPAPPAPPAAANAPKPAEPPVPPLVKRPFLIGFTAEQGKFRMAFNNLLRSPQLLIVRSLSIKNSNPQGPQIASATEPAASTPASLFAEGSEAPKAESTLNVILGKELVRVDLALEIVDFKVPVKGATTSEKTP
jgi:hypothetical protein